MKYSHAEIIRPDLSYYLLFFILSGSMLYFSSLRIDYTVQGYISGFIIFFLIILRYIRRKGFWRVLFLALSSFIVLRYFFWRSLYTLEYQGLFSFAGSIALFTAEVYGGLMFFLSAFVNVRPLQRRSVPLPDQVGLWPTVDVIIPSYNEPVDLVKITLSAASNIDYPENKLRIYLLDDGATEQKLHAADYQSRLIAKHRQQSLQDLCASLNIHYLSRKDNNFAKAGNMNAALAHITGELILVLDADHAPAVDILKKTVGAFIQDEKTFLVQTPHFFINPDPLEKNLNLFQRMPAENLMFYGAIQLGLDFWQSSFFCGSAAVLRRKAIDEVGGFRGKTITEDSETALLLHSRGWKSQYLMHPLISGLQPETFSSFIIQRIRWAQGMVQNLIFHNPLMLPNLSIWQRVSYLSNMLFWFFPFARIIYLISPGLFLLFGLKIYNVNAVEFFSYTLPYLLALTLTNHYLFSKVRWIFLSEIYEILQTMFSLRAVWAVLKNPKKPKFAVTPKMETVEEDFISPLSKPFYWTIAIILLQILCGIWRYFEYPQEQSLITITIFWACFNLLLLLSVLGVLYEHKQRRVHPRIPVKITANLRLKTDDEVNERRVDVTINDLSASERRVNSRIPVKINANLLLNSGDEANERGVDVTINDLSTSGGKIFISTILDGAYSPYNCRLDITDPRFPAQKPLNIEMVNRLQEGEGCSYGIRFKCANIDDFRNVVRFVHGDSSRWLEVQELAGQDPGLIKTIFIMTKTGLYYGFSHIKLAVKLFTKVKDYA